MCSMYWNLDTRIKCPNCGKASLWNLQTHFMGDVWSCENTYKLGEKVAELKGVDVVLDGRIDDFCGDCEECGKFFDLGAKITKGEVVKVWFLKEITTE